MIDAKFFLFFLACLVSWVDDVIKIEFTAIFFILKNFWQD